MKKLFLSILLILLFCGCSFTPLISDNSSNFSIELGDVKKNKKHVVQIDKFEYLFSALCKNMLKNISTKQQLILNIKYKYSEPLKILEKYDWGGRYIFKSRIKYELLDFNTKNVLLNGNINVSDSFLKTGYIGVNLLSMDEIMKTVIEKTINDLENELMVFLKYTDKS